LEFEPQKFFLGLTDFVAILLPGAIIAYILDQPALGQLLLGSGFQHLQGTQGWVAFFLASYLLGHFIFLLGSWIIDDHFYDKIRDATKFQQVRRLANEKTAKRGTEGCAVSSRFFMWLAKVLIKETADRAVTRAAAIKNQHLQRINASDTINTFQWCKARLAIEHPEALAVVERFEATSKFFRSLLVVQSFLILWGVASYTRAALAGSIPYLHLPNWHGPVIALVSIGLLPLTLWRYVDQRVKATNQAYWYIITLEANRTDSSQPSNLESETPSHAGGVVIRARGPLQMEYLLVTATPAPHEWVLPKGHVEQGETTRETAVREVYEETGVWACCGADLQISEYTVHQTPVRVQFYLMRAIEERKPSEDRQHKWFSLNDALGLKLHQEIEDLLKIAEERRTQ
jgi:8-oxo-dGTP pyrophosphatase MutT (NUDIX family)